MKNLWSKTALAVALAGAFALAGCLGDDKTTVLNEHVDIPGIPQVTELSSVLDPGYPQTIEGLFDEANQPIRIAFSNEVQMNLGYGSVSIDSMIYDPNTEKWFITLDGETVVLGGGNGLNGDSPCPIEGTGICVELGTPGRGVEYGKLIKMTVRDAITGDETEIFGHFGFLTPADQMPTTGTGTYTGDFIATVDMVLAGGTAPSDEEIVSIDGKADMTVDFGATSDQVTLDLTGTGTPINAQSGAVVQSNVSIADNDNDGLYDPAVDGLNVGILTGTLDLTHTASIDGNTFTGTGSGTYDTNAIAPVLGDDVLAPTNDPVDDLVLSGTVDGAFYGVFAQEAVGTISGGDLDPTDGGLGASAIGTYAGGFEVDLRSHVPPPPAP